MIFKKHSNRAPNSIRINLFAFLFAIFLLVIYGRLFVIQIIDSPRYRLMAKKQYESKITLKPTRGMILDRKLNPLVTASNNFSYAADPNMVDNKDSIASLFASVFLKDKESYLEKLNAKNTSFVWLERKVEQKYSALLENLNFSGVIKINESQRVYNYGTVASQLLGLTDIDNNGISGIEFQYNNVLGGKEGCVIMQKDGLGGKRSALEYPRVEPENGNNLVLTIDVNIQKIIEEELDRAVILNNAQGGKCIVMAVKTGEILGVYSAVNRKDSVGELSQNKLSVLTDLYEPGSTFKLVTAAASLEEGIQTKNDIIQIHGGEYRFHNLKITDSHKFPSLTFRQVIEQSSNVGMIQVALKLGERKFYKYARDFGFGNQSGIDFPGESKGILKRPVDFSPVSLKFMAIGYEVLVTALQMTNAYAAVANGGILMKPFVVKREVSAGNTATESKPVTLRNVLSPNTARTLTELLYGVVEKGTGVEAKINNLKIAGKTGTAQKLIAGHYSKESYTSSFIGYFPADDPKIVVSVILDAPKANEYYGGKVAAPVFRNITERLVNIGALAEDYGSEYQTVNTINNNTPAENIESNSESFINLVNFDLNDAVDILKEKQIKYEVMSDNGKKISESESVVAKQEIIFGKDSKSIKKIKLFISEKRNQKETTVFLTMPLLEGASLRKAISVLASMGLEFTVRGSGRVISQNPEAGIVLTSAIRKQRIILLCEPLQGKTTGGYLADELPVLN